MFLKLINDMFIGWKNSWFKVILNFSAIGLFFKTYQKQEISSYDFLKVFFSSHWFVQWLFKRYILTAQDQHLFENFTNNTYWLDLIAKQDSEKTHTGDNYKKIPKLGINNKLQVFTESLQILNNVGLLDKKNFDSVCNHLNPVQFLLSIAKLYSYQMLNQKNLNCLLMCPNPNILEKVATALSHLNINHLLDQKNSDYVSNSKNPEQTARAFTILHRLHILNPQTSIYISNHENPVELANAICQLHLEKILDSENLKLIAASKNLDELINGLIELKHKDILNPENASYIAKSSAPDRIAQAFCLLHEAQILNQNNQKALMKFQYLYPVLKGLEKLKLTLMLNQGNFDLIIAKQNPTSIFSSELLDTIDTINNKGIPECEKSKCDFKM